MTDAERATHYRQALERIATPNAFDSTPADLGAPAFFRMIYAQAILDYHTLESANAKAEYETRRTYPA